MSAAPLEGDAADAPLETASAGTGTILLVEDENVVRALIQETLEASGYQVLAAATPSSALELAEHTPQIDLLLTDLVMPEMGGRALSERIVAEHPETKVLYISGYSREDQVEAGSLEPGRAFLQKPFFLSALHEDVSTMLPAAPPETVFAHYTAA